MTKAEKLVEYTRRAVVEEAIRLANQATTLEEVRAELKQAIDEAAHTKFDSINQDSSAKSHSTPN